MKITVVGATTIAVAVLVVVHVLRNGHVENPENAR